MFRKNTDLRRIHRSVFHRIQSACHDLALCIGHNRRHNRNSDLEAHNLSRQSYAVCDGASQLSYAFPQKRAYADVGKSKGFRAEGVHTDIRRVNHYLGSQNL